MALDTISGNIQTTTVTPAAVPALEANEHAITLAVIAGAVGPWKNPLAVIGTFSRRLASQWPSTNGNMTMPLGSTIRIEREQNFNVREGFTADPQPWQTETLLATFDDPIGVDDSKHQWEPTLYVSPKKMKETTRRMAHRLMTRIETKCVQTAAEGHYSRASFDGTGASASLITPGSDADPSTTRTAILQLLQARSYFQTTLGMLRRLHYCMQPSMGVGLAMDTLNAPFEQTGAGSYAKTGSYSGEKAGVYMKPSNLNGTLNGGPAPSAANAFTSDATGNSVEVNAAPTEGATSIVLKNVKSGGLPPVGFTLYFEGCYAVNRETGDVTEYLQPFRVTGGTASTTTPTVNVDPPFRFESGMGTSQSSTEAKNRRKRTCSKAPAASAKVFVLEPNGGIPTTGATGQDDAWGGKEITRSFLALNDTSYLTFAAPELPRSGVVRANMVATEQYNIAMSAVSAYDVRNTQTINRLDAMISRIMVEPEAAGKIWGASVAA